MRSIKFSKHSKKFLEKLPPKQQKQIGQCAVSLQTNAEPHDSQKLKGYDFRRLDVGEYRVIYNFDESTIYIYLVGKRNDGEVYKRLKRLTR